MKDPVFSGRDVSEAVRLASRTLAVPEAALRYVVLDAGQPGGRGLAPTAARIAVLTQHLPAREERAASDRGGEGRGTRRRASSEQAPVAQDRAQAARRLVEEFARSAGCRIDAEVVAGAEGLEVELRGAGTSVLFDPRGETLAALQHLFERLGEPGGRVRVHCAGYREYRDECLREEALALARQVRADGQARTTEPLNSYERRIVHLTLDGDPDLRTFSVGEGRGRRVTIAPGGVGLAGGVDESRVEPAPPAPAPAEALVAGRKPEPPAFDVRRYDRPPEGGGAPELM